MSVYSRKHDAIHRRGVFNGGYLAAHHLGKAAAYRKKVTRNHYCGVSVSSLKSKNVGVQPGVDLIGNALIVLPDKPYWQARGYVCFGCSRQNARGRFYFCVIIHKGISSMPQTRQIKM